MTMPLGTLRDVIAAALPGTAHARLPTLHAVAGPPQDTEELQLWQRAFTEGSQCCNLGPAHAARYSDMARKFAEARDAVVCGARDAQPDAAAVGMALRPCVCARAPALCVARYLYSRAPRQVLCHRFVRADSVVCAVCLWTWM